MVTPGQSEKQKAPDISALVNLAEDRLGAEALFATDDFFAPKARMLKAEAPVAKPGTFDDNGQWMDGWESRRRRGGGHDYCVVKLAFPGEIEVIDLDTCYFTGNYPPQASLEALPEFWGSAESVESDPLQPDAPWREILTPQELSGNQHNLFTISDHGPWRYLRLHIYPDGGIARLRTFGRVALDWEKIQKQLKPGESLDLLAVENGGIAILANDQHYGSITHLNRPGRGINMGDGWETRRRRESGHDWVIVELGHPGQLDKVCIDTAHFRGNFPESVSLEGIFVNGVCREKPSGKASGSDSPPPANTQPGPDADWQPLMPPQPLGPDAVHDFQQQLLPHETISHVKINIHPDGGLSRVRLYGIPSCD